MKSLYLGFALVLSFSLFAQEEKSLQDYYTAATSAYEAKNYELFLENIRKADEMRPNHPAIVPKLAAAWALTGRKIRSIQKLNQMLLMDATFNFVDNPDFDNVRTHKNYKRLIALQTRLAEEEVNDELYMTIDAGHLHPESFVILKNGEMLLGSVREKKIVKVGLDGKVTDWVETPYAVLGMKADFARGNLWVSTAAMPEMKGFEQADNGKSVVLQIDLNTGKIIQGISYDEESIIGDLEVDQENRLWLSNSMTPFLSRDNTDTSDYLGAFNRKQFDLSDGYFNLQGLTLTDDENYLYVSDYIKGLFRIDINDTDIDDVFAPESSLLKGIDGLYYYDNSLIAIHNGTKPYRVVQYFLNASGLNIESERIINRGGESLGEPTLGQVKDGYFYYLANSPWQAYDQEKNLDLSKVKPIEIRRFKLD
ncbi:hypothetical protein BFP97_03300 [Roseivirga sp. 4D4]|uniref:hypothetical protein n=1 Tax=Roseivirga sp. 4D4 TaxID=1889784 RepID=UPI0008535090|nr:hypothetical protein [Roseivirga sp. 4D4]OEK00589.1 hypothetical protein BFP97_03300 [Roseivirga sp. 4D4]